MEHVATGEPSCALRSGHVVKADRTQLSSGDLLVHSQPPALGGLHTPKRLNRNARKEILDVVLDSETHLKSSKRR